MSEKNNVVIKLITGKNSDCFNNTFDEIIGQKSAIGQLKFYAVTNSSIKPFPTVLLQGSHGLGKTYLSEKIANSLNRKFIVINAETIKSKDVFVEDILLNKILGNELITILFDEAHMLPNDVVPLLLTLLSPNQEYKNILSYGKYEIEYDMKKINAIFATNEHYQIPIALRNRCLPVILTPYNNKEIIQIVKLYISKDISITCNENELAYACRGRARNSLKMAGDIDRVCAMFNKKVFSNEELSYLKKTLDIYDLGLNKEEINMLKIINEESPISSYNLATKMMEDEKTILQDYEIRPRELGLMTNNGKGRILTQKGIKYLENLSILEEV